MGNTKKKFNLGSFRNTKNNNIFSTWSPYSRGLTFYTFLINYFVEKNKVKFIKFKKKINNKNIGNPPKIILNNKLNITYDDCLSFEEIIFLKKFLKTKKELHILEVGPGYGRSAEAILKNFNIKKYFVIDYKKILPLTKNYLKNVLSEKYFNKIVFIEFEKFDFKRNFLINLNLIYL